MDKKLVASELVKLAKDLIAIEFDTDEAMKKYLKEHPGADKSLHHVKKESPKQAPKKESNFSEDTDKWYDDAAEHSGNPKHEDEPIKEVKKIVNHGDTPATKEKLEKVEALLKKSKHPAANKILEHIKNIKGGKYKNEFKYHAGGKQHDTNSSTIKEFFSMLRQGLGYKD